MEQNRKPRNRRHTKMPKWLLMKIEDRKIKWPFFFFILSFLHLFICVYIAWATSLLPFWFCWRQNIRDNKKDIAFLLVWDKDTYTERFLALLPCTCVLQPTLVHLYQTSSLLPGPPPIVASASLRLLYSLLYEMTFLIYDAGAMSIHRKNK
jgi:hypothetical protein